MAINERLIHTAADAAAGGSAEAEQGLILHLDANDVDSYDGDGAVWYDIANYDVIVPLSDNASNLKVHIDFADTSCYSGTGTTVNDLSSNNTTINTLSGSVEADFERGFLNVSENSNEGLTISDHADFDHTNGATYEGWVYLDPNGTNEETFFFRGPSNAQGLRIYWHASYGWFPRDFNASGSEIIDQNNIKTGSSGFGRGKWYHLALTLSSASGATYKFYVDGNLIGYYTASGGGQNSLSYDISLGEYAGGGVADLHGKIAQFRFYNKVLSATEIGQNYRHGRNNSYTDLIPDTDLELHLDAASFDGSTNTPTTWTDSSGNSNNGTITGATFDSELGNWLDFDGTSDTVTLGTQSYFHSTNDFTAEFWVKRTANDENILFKLGSTHPTYYFLYQPSLGYWFKDYTAGSRATYTGSISETLNEWTHIVLVVDGGTAVPKIYVNGEHKSASATGGSGGTSGSKDLIIGQGKVDAAWGDWEGEMGQVRWYSSKLTQDQIRQNYNFTKPSYPNGFDGAITNATWYPSGYFDFNGSNSKVDLGTSFANNVSETTYAAWVNFDNLNTQNFIIFPDSGTTGHGFGFFDFGNGNIYFQSDNTANSNRGSVSNSGLYTTGQWVHIAQVYDGNATGNANRLKAYVNGNLLSLTFSGTIPSTTGATAYNTLVGTRVNSNLSLDGQISKVKIYDKALTQAEITALFSEGQ